jgi:hypothetical protein
VPGIRLATQPLEHECPGTGAASGNEMLAEHRCDLLIEWDGSRAGISLHRRARDMHGRRLGGEIGPRGSPVSPSASKIRSPAYVPHDSGTHNGFYSYEEPGADPELERALDSLDVERPPETTRQTMKPTRGFEPRTPSLRGRRGVWRWLWSVAPTAYDKPISAVSPPSVLRFVQGGVLPPCCHPRAVQMVLAGTSQSPSRRSLTGSLSPTPGARRPELTLAGL